MSMMKLVTIKIQESPKLRGVNQDKGITSDDLSTDRVTVADAVHGKIHEVMSEQLGYILDQLCDPANFADVEAAEKVDMEKVRSSMEANILKFKIDAGGGYTDTHKAHLVANGTDSGVEVTPVDFIDPKNRGGSETASKPSENGGNIEL